MTLAILDTDHVSLSQRGHPLILQQMATLGRDNLATTIITVEEQIQGRFTVIKRVNRGQKLVQAYLDLQDTLGYFTTLPVLAFNDAANIYFETLRQQKIRIGTYDLRIAAIVLSVQGTLITRNWRDFKQVPGLVVEDWSTTTS